MRYDTRLKDLFTKQENQIKAFERQRAEMLKAVQTTELELLQLSGCSYTDAPPHVLEIITKLREDYARYWGNDGVLLNELIRRQTIARQKILNLLQPGNNNND